MKYVIISGIKKYILAYDRLDDEYFNDTISIIENKEMAARAMSPSITFDASICTTTAANSNYKNSKNIQSKLAIKVKCKKCDKLFLKFKLLRNRNGKQTFCEFSLCIDGESPNHTRPPDI